jgi:hypothetical protein
MMISMDKEYRTRSGDEVRIYAVDGNESRPIHGAFKGQTGWVSCCWPRGGAQIGYEGPYDLVEVKPRIKREVWLTLYPDGVKIYANKKQAEYHASPDSLACVKVEIDVEEGEGL